MMKTQYRVVGRLKKDTEFKQIFGKTFYSSLEEETSELNKVIRKIERNGYSSLVTPIGTITIEEPSHDYDTVEVKIISRQVSDWADI